MRLRDLAELFFSYNAANRRPRTVEFYRTRLALFVAKYGDQEAETLRPFHVLAFRCTWHLVLSVQRLFRWAADEQEILAANPMLKLRRPRLGARRRTLTRAELMRVFRASRPAFRRFLMALRETAARPQEIRELDWKDIRWNGDYRALAGELAAGRCYFQLSDYKGRSRRADTTEPRLIPVSPRLGRTLARLAVGRPLAGRVFVTEAGAGWNRNSLRLRMRRTLIKAGLADTVRGERIVCYSMRHTAATDLAGRGMQTSVLQQLLGHANIRTTQRYVHFQQRHLIEQWEQFHKRRK